MVGILKHKKPKFTFDRTDIIACMLEYKNLPALFCDQKNKKVIYFAIIILLSQNKFFEMAMQSILSFTCWEPSTYIYSLKTKDPKSPLYIFCDNRNINSIIAKKMYIGI